MTLQVFRKYIKQLPVSNYLVKIRLKYDNEKYYRYTHELFIWNWETNEYEWYMDWNEGEQDIEILGCIDLDDVIIENTLGEDD